MLVVRFAPPMRPVRLATSSRPLVKVSVALASMEIESVRAALWEMVLKMSTFDALPLLAMRSPFVPSNWPVSEVVPLTVPLARLNADAVSVETEAVAKVVVPGTVTPPASGT